MGRRDLLCSFRDRNVDYIQPDSQWQEAAAYSECHSSTNRIGQIASLGCGSEFPVLLPFVGMGAPSGNRENKLVSSDQFYTAKHHLHRGSLGRSTRKSLSSRASRIPEESAVLSICRFQGATKKLRRMIAPLSS
jgi:hypothetical protein